MTFFSSPLDRRGAVLFDRDGTLVEDVPSNADPALVSAVPGAREAVRRVRDAGFAVGVVTNQPLIGEGLATRDEVDLVNAAVDDAVGPFDAWFVCPHAPRAGCGCRKPRPGLVLEAGRFFDLAPERLIVVGDIGADIEAASAAGTRGVLVPTPVTRASEVDAADLVAADLEAAVTLALAFLETREAVR